MYTAVGPQYYTPEEYLQLEELAETKNDYIGGRGKGCRVWGVGCRGKESVTEISKDLKK